MQLQQLGAGVAWSVWGLPVLSAISLNTTPHGPLNDTQPQPTSPMQIRPLASLHISHMNSDSKSGSVQFFAFCGGS